MVGTRNQAQILINRFSKLFINQQVQMAAPVVNYIISPFDESVNPGYPQGIKNYILETREIDKEADKLDISVSNDKEIIYHFLNIAK